ncbi:MAG: hypothetical protein MJ252_29770 [archaeon]|nr:hypothetical protein [archaeon]
MKALKRSIAFQIFIIAISVFISKEDDHPKYKKILQWGKENGLYISEKLAMNYTDENTRNYYLTEDVKTNETLLEIPLQLTMSSLQIKDMFKKNKKIKKLYKKINPEGTISLNKQKDFSLEESFITSVLYLVNESPEKFRKSEFVKFYGPYLDNMETNAEYYPYYYTKEQRELFSFTSFGGMFDLVDKMCNEDAKALTEIVGPEIIMDEFAKYKVLTANKGINVTGHYHLIPFADMFDKNPVKFNLNMTYNETTGNLEVFATKDISSEDHLFLVAPYTPNVNSLLLFGNTYDETIPYIKSFNLPMILPSFVESKGYNADKANTKATVELTDGKFYEKIVNVYKDFLRKIGKESNELTAMQMFLENLEYLRASYNRINPSSIHRNFIGKKSIRNAIRLIEGEKRFVDDRINAMRQVIDIFKTEIKKKQEEEAEKNKKKEEPKKEKKSKKKRKKDEDVDEDIDTSL